MKEFEKWIKEQKTTNNVVRFGKGGA